PHCFPLAFCQPLLSGGVPAGSNRIDRQRCESPDCFDCRLQVICRADNCEQHLAVGSESNGECRHEGAVRKRLDYMSTSLASLFTNVHEGRLRIECSDLDGSDFVSASECHVDRLRI